MDEYSESTTLARAASSIEASDLGDAERYEHARESSAESEGILNNNGKDVESPSSKGLNNLQVGIFPTKKEITRNRNAERTEKERDLLSQLTAQQQAIIEQVLEIVRNTESRWLVMLFKRVSSVRSRELFRQLGEPERFFEAASGKGDYWREAWSDPKLGKQDEHASRKKLGSFISNLLKSFGR